MFKTELELSKLIDHTLLKPNATSEDLAFLCDQADVYNFKMVAINQTWTKFCTDELIDSEVRVGAAIAFPLGQTSIESKVAETKDAIKNGADEIDYVLHIGKLLEKDYDYIEDEMRKVVSVCKENKVISKVIFETCYLEDQDIIAASQIAKKVKPTFIKTSTGFGPEGATLENVKLMKCVVGDDVLVKAAGGIRDLAKLTMMVENGASRIGTSSGIKIMEEYRRQNK